MITTNTTIEEIKAIPIFFIIGRPRTGTTLIQSIFDSHPNVMIPAECPVMIKLFNKFNNVEKWSRSKITEVVREIKNVRKVEFWRINYEKLENELNYLVDDLDIRSILKILYLNFISAYDKNEILLIGDKNPSYSRFQVLLYKIFPDAKFLIIHRDYRDHFLSMKKSGLMNKVEPAIIYSWKRYVFRWKQMEIKYPKQMLSFKYEDFIHEPEKHLQIFCNFLNIQYSNDLLNFYTNKERALNQYKEKNSEVFHENLYKPIISTNTDKWKKKLNEKEIMIADYVAGKAAHILDYKPKYTSFSLRFRFYMLPRLIVLSIYKYIRTLILFFPYNYRVKFIRMISSSDGFYLRFFKN